jgi:hydroxyacylglutathione hydrolase
LTFTVGTQETQDMLVSSTTTGKFDTNAHVIAEGPGQPCLIVDPGHDAAAEVHELVRRHRLVPEAVLLTHGHMDHTWDALPLAQHYAIPAWIHRADRYQFGAPAAGLPDSFPQDLLVGHPNQEPDQVHEFPEHGGPLRFTTAGVTVLHTPGHTPGSVMFRIDGDRPLLITGDTLLASGPGRSDAPDGSPTGLAASVRQVRESCPGETLLLPGHGPRIDLAQIGS